jgi:lysophospholipase L1-like esterase
VQRYYAALLLVISSALGIAVAEIALRMVAPDHFFVWPPNLSVTFAATMPGLSGESHFVINESGVRGRSFSDADRYRILAVGGSTTECLYLDDSEAWPHLLESQLNEGAFHPSPVWVGNVGKSGHTSTHHVLQVEKLLDQYPHIDLVLVLAGANDMIWVLQNSGYAPLGNTERSLAFAVGPGGWNETDVDYPFYKRTEIWRALRKAKENVLARHDADLVQDTTGAVYLRERSDRQQAARYVDTIPDLTAALDAYRDNLNAIADVAGAHGTEVVFATQPSLWMADMPMETSTLLWWGRIGHRGAAAPSDYYSTAALAMAMSAFNDVLLDVCGKRSLRCLDLASAVPRSATPFYDDVHFTEAGSRIVADAFVDFLLKK